MSDAEVWLIAIGILAVYGLCVFIAYKTGTDLEVHFLD